MIFDLIADVADYRHGEISIKSPIRQALNISPGQYLYPYIDSQNKLLYLFVYELRREQHFITFRFGNINSFIEFSRKLAKEKINIIASKHIAISDDNEISLIYDIPENRPKLHGSGFINLINEKRNDTKYNEINLVKSVWYGNEELFVKLMDYSRKQVHIPERKVSAIYTISLAGKVFKKLGFDNSNQIKKCVQIAYPGILAIVFRFFDDDKIKKVELGYKNFEGSYATMLELLSSLEIKSIVSIQKNTNMGTEQGCTVNTFILKYPHNLDTVFNSPDSDKKLKIILNEKYNQISNTNEMFLYICRILKK